jgi:hypothetical protein
VISVKNPIKQILASNSPAGIKVIALSLMLVLVTAAPIMLYILFGPEDGNPVGLGLLFAAGALVGHIGFLVGMLMLLRDYYFRRK